MVNYMTPYTYLRQPEVDPGRRITGPFTSAMLEALKINRLNLTSFQRPALRLLYLVKLSESGEAVMKLAGKMQRKILNWHGAPASWHGISGKTCTEI
jgi:hypothetical protein